MPTYTSISFAPVQSFIEKSRKLRDLFGASLILSYLSSKLVEFAQTELKDPECVISPGLINVGTISQQEGMPNRILVKGHLDRDRVKNELLREWQKILHICQKWIERNLGIPHEQYFWAQREEDIGNHKKEWERWGSYTWELFWGTGETPIAAMKDLETRKLKRDWVGINWIGESSSLSGTDAIAWNRLGEEHREPGRSLNEQERQELKRFYHRLAWILDKPEERVVEQRNRQLLPSDEELEKYFENNKGGRYLAPNEYLNIPELTKRLITYDIIAEEINIPKLREKKSDPEFRDIIREPGYWTGWFIGDGDQVGNKLKCIADRNANNLYQQEQDLRHFSQLMRKWGQGFKCNRDLFPDGKGRVIYAGGDDFLGVLYSEEIEKNQTSEPVKPIEAMNWLFELENQWKPLQAEIYQDLNLKITYSVGFVWAGHQVPQRDILQHCREAEQRAKSLGRDRVTIRVVFNSGQYVQWTCPWDYLNILSKYRDRDGRTWGDDRLNWNHIYSDWAELKARHAIRLQEMEDILIKKEIALVLFNLYFDSAGEEFTQERKWDELAGGNRDRDIVHWIDDLIQVGWQLCRKNPSNS